MTLELARIAAQVDEMSKSLAGRALRERQALPAARALLGQYAEAREMLTEVAQSAAGQRLRCARPGFEPLDGVYGASRALDRATLVAVDGSQIYPDSHGLALYYVINVGSVVFRRGSGGAPLVGSVPRLFHTDADLFPQGELISSDQVSAQRSLAEMEALVELAHDEPADGPARLALTDGPLVIWLGQTAISREVQMRILDRYLGSLDRLRQDGAAVAGFVSRPHGAEVVALLYLAAQPEAQRMTVAGLHETSFRGLTDRALFGFLAAGERSPLFARATATNREFEARGHCIYFFLLNTGAEVARVEVPEWVAGVPDALSLVHAALLEQCRVNQGYPYVLTRADEQAVVLSEERAVLEGMICSAALRHGLDWPELSQKAQQKQAARWRRR